MRPPLNAAIGDSRASGSTSIDIPRGGRPLVTAKAIPAAWSSWTAAIERVAERLVRPDERPVDVREHEADHFVAR